jgi:hypothetical protein
MAERRELLRLLVDQIQLAPERLQIEVTYRVPVHYLVRRFQLPSRGRRRRARDGTTAPTFAPEARSSLTASLFPRGRN